MKRFTTRLAFVAAAVMMLIASCSKDNTTPTPGPVPGPDVPGKAFSVLVKDSWTGISADSVYTYCGTVNADCYEGVTFTEGYTKTGLTFNNTPDVVDLIQTPYNQIAFETSSPVTVLSSDASIRVSTTDSVHFTVGAYTADAEGLVTFASGSGSLAKTVTIKVLARKTVEVEGFEVAFSNRDGSGRKVVALIQVNKKYDDLIFKPAPDGELVYTLPLIGYTLEQALANYHNHGDPQLTEDSFDLTKATVFEFVGTVPRNATPDNNVIQACDPVSHYQNSLDTITGNFHPWNKKCYKEYRWTPIVKKGSTNARINDSEQRPVNPCDIRYLKAVIWNRNYADRVATIPQEFIRYRVETKTWWGVIGAAAQ